MSVEEDRQRRRRSENLPTDVRVVSVGIETETRKTVEKKIQGHAHLEACEVGPEACVWPVTERDVRLRVFPLYVVPVWL